MRAITLFLILFLTSFLSAEKYEEQFTYYSVPREVVNEYREVDGKVYNIGKRKTFETVKRKADVQTQRRIRHLPSPMPEWKWFSTSGISETVIDKFDNGILIGSRARLWTDTRSGRQGTTTDNMTGFIVNHPDHKRIAAGDYISCWVYDTGKTKSTQFGPVKIYDYGKKVEAPNSTTPPKSKPVAAPTK